MPAHSSERHSADRHAADRLTPWVQLKYFSFHPCIYQGMTGAASPDARPGDIVNVYDKTGQLFGRGFHNPKARVPLRMLTHKDEPVDEAFFLRALDRCVDLRLKLLNLNETGDTYRVVNSDGDALSGLVVDRFGDFLSVEVHSLGVWLRVHAWVKHLHSRLGTKAETISVDPKIAEIEGIRVPKPQPPRPAKIKEHGVRYEVDFASGHKTGFFCDQRDNRLKLAKLCKGLSVLDLCCYTGGFSLAAKIAGGAGDVTAVDLDEAAIAQAKRNANLNQSRVEWIHADAYAYARQMQKNGRQWDVVILDPPKFVHDREMITEDLRKYEDLNALGAHLVAPGGLLVTCSCSGLVTAEQFEETVIRGVHRARRRLQIIDRTGAGGDHPVMSNCPEGRYLKLVWGRVW